MFISDFKLNWGQRKPQRQFPHALGFALKGGKIGAYKFGTGLFISKDLAAYTVMCAVKTHLIKTCCAFYYTLGQLACA